MKNNLFLFLFFLIHHSTFAQEQTPSSDRYDSLCNAVVAFCEAGDFTSAHASVSEAIIENERLFKGKQPNPQLYYIKAFCVRRIASKEPEAAEKKAIQLLNKAISIDSSFGYMFYERALAKKFSNARKNAIQDLNKAIALEPTNFVYYDERNTCHSLVETPYRIRKNDLYQGIYAFDLLASEVEKNYNKARAYQMIFHFMQNKAFIDTSLFYYAKAIEASQAKNSEIFYERGVLYRNDLRNYPLAIQDLKQAVGLDSTNLSAFLNLAWSYGHNQQFELSYQAFVLANKYFPTDWQVQEGLKEMDRKRRKK